MAVEEIYGKAGKDPLKFWGSLAEGIYWRKKWQKIFENQPQPLRGEKGKNEFLPKIKWFVGGRLNLSENCLDRNLAERGGRPAVIWEAEPLDEKPRILTYKELFEETNKLANAFKKLGVKKGDRVAIYLPMIPEIIISMLAAARIGAVHSVVFSAFSPAALKTRLQDTGAKILITADGYWRRGRSVRLKEAADEAIKGTKINKVIVVKRMGRRVKMEKGRDFWYEDLVKKEEPSCPARSLSSEDLLFILYTSGSTGKPKGCCHTCGGYAVQAKWTGKWIFDWREGDVFWCTADIGWVTGHTYAVYSPLLNGITTLLFEGVPDFPTPDRWAKIIEKHKVTSFYTAPTVIRVFERYGLDLSHYKFKNLRLLGSVGEPMDEGAWQWYFKKVGRGKCPLVDTWWQTETGGILISSLPGIGPFKPAFAGKPFPGVKMDVWDEKGKSCPEGKEGNLVLLPPFVPAILRGIYRRPKKYFETYWELYKGKAYLTADAAYRDKDGLIRVVGRVDDVIKVAGHRLTTGEMENSLAALPEITECAVVGKKDEIKGEVPVAFVVVKKGKKTILAEEIRKKVEAQIKKTIGPIALLKEIYLVPDLPKTRSGKIMRRVLKKIFSGEPLGDLSTLANPDIVPEIKRIVESAHF